MLITGNLGECTQKILEENKVRTSLHGDDIALWSGFFFLIWCFTQLNLYILCTYIVVCQAFSLYSIGTSPCH